MAAIIPVLGPGGWVRGVKEKLDVAFAHAMQTDVNQFNEFSDEHVCALPNVIYTTHNQPDTCVAAITASLQRYFGSLFDTVEVSVTHNATEENNNYAIQIAVTVTDGGVRATLASAYHLKEGRIAEVANSINL